MNSTLKMISCGDLWKNISWNCCNAKKVLVSEIPFLQDFTILWYTHWHFQTHTQTHTRAHTHTQTQTHTHTHTHIYIYIYIYGSCTRDVDANSLDKESVVSKFKLQIGNNIHFRINTQEIWVNEPHHCSWTRILIWY